MIDIKFEFPDLRRKVKASKREIELLIAATLQTNRGMMFDKEGSHNGHPRWAPLVLRSGQILSKRGTLRKSIAPTTPTGIAGPGGIVEIMPDVIAVGTSMAYAAMMNFGTTNLPGGVLRPVRAKALKIPLPQGDNASAAAEKIKQDMASKARKKRIAKLQGQLRRAKKKDSMNRIADQIASLQMQEKRKSTLGAPKFMFRKSVKIPARRFDELNDRDREEIEATVNAKIMEILNR